MKKIDISLCNKIFEYVILVLLLIINLNTEKSLDNTNLYIIHGIIITISLIYIIINIKKIKINALDIFVFVFLVISPFIPIIFGTNCSLSDSINSILNNITILSIYSIIRIISKNSKKFVEMLISIIIVSAAIQFIYSIDVFTFNIAEKFLKTHFFDFTLKNGEIRLSGAFEYANTYAVFMASTIFLCMYKLSKNEVIKNAIYSGMIFLLLSGLMLSYSRTVWVIAAILLIFYLILNRKQFKVHYILLVNFTLALIFSNIFMKEIVNSNYFIIYLILGIEIVMSFLFSILIEKSINKFSMTNTNKINIIFIICTLIISIILGILYTKSCEIKLFSNANSQDTVRRVFINIGSDLEYNFEFDIDSKALVGNEDIFTIKIEEKDKDSLVVNEQDISFGNYQGIKNINLTTTKDTVGIIIYFKCNNLNLAESLEIKSLKINGQEEILEYKYIPMEMVVRAQNINIKTHSVNERKVFFIDTLNLAKDYWLTGIGDNGWSYRYTEVRSYNYYATQTHCYLAKVFLEYGIIGLLFCFLIVIIIIIKSYGQFKNKNKVYTTIFIALFMILFHSLLDVDLTYYSILVDAFIFIAVLNSLTNWKREIDLKKAIISIPILIMIIAGICNFSKGYAKIILNESIENYEEKIKMYDKCIAYSLNDKRYIKDKIIYMQNYKSFYYGSGDNAKDEINKEITKLKTNEPYYKNNKIEL